MIQILSVVLETQNPIVLKLGKLSHSLLYYFFICRNHFLETTLLPCIIGISMASFLIPTISS